MAMSMAVETTAAATNPDRTLPTMDYGAAKTL